MDEVDFPFPVIETTRHQALALWETLFAEGQGHPLILGRRKEAEQMLEFFDFPPPPGFADGEAWVKAQIEKAAELSHPASLLAWQKAGIESLAALSKSTSETSTSLSLAADDMDLDFGDFEPKDGDWPDDPQPQPGPGLLADFFFKRDPSAPVLLTRLPVTDWTETPALLRLGGWNDCPPAEYHIAALRSLRDRYGAIMVGCSFDQVDLRVDRGPATKEEARALARELHLYCNDTIDQGCGTVNAYAAYLMHSRWWSFWWD